MPAGRAEAVKSQLQDVGAGERRMINHSENSGKMRRKASLSANAATKSGIMTVHIQEVKDRAAAIGMKIPAIVHPVALPEPVMKDLPSGKKAVRPGRQGPAVFPAVKERAA